MSAALTGAPAWIRITSAELQAEIDPLGAQLSVLRDTTGRDLLWQGDPAVWSGRAPLLFPIVGTLAGGQYRLGAKSFALGRHGFARGSRFSIVRRDAQTADFKLLDDEITRAIYPFHFELLARFAVQGSVLTVTLQVTNTGDGELPASMGFHPGFLWPLPGGGARAEHSIEFEVEEPAPARRIDAQGLLTSQRHATPIVDCRLRLDDALFKDDVLIFDQIRSRRVVYGVDGGRRIGIHFPDATYLGVWTRRGAPFVCIEPWQGITDPADYAGDFRDKPGIFALAPGASRTLTMSITLF